MGADAALGEAKNTVRSETSLHIQTCVCFCIANSLEDMIHMGKATTYHSEGWFLFNITATWTYSIESLDKLHKTSGISLLSLPWGIQMVPVLAQLLQAAHTQNDVPQSKSGWMVLVVDTHWRVQLATPSSSHSHKPTSKVPETKPIKRSPPKHGQE